MRLRAPCSHYLLLCSFLWQNGVGFASIVKKTNNERRALRVEKLNEYDRILGPIIPGSASILTLEFSLRINKLVKVDTKNQVIVLDVWVFQRWNDVFLKWRGEAKYQVTKTRFSPQEIWVPDVALINNADKSVRLAGGPELFKTDLNVWQGGKVEWVAPASFTSDCKLRVRYWPIDDQFCTLTFSSWTYDDQEIIIETDDSELTRDHLHNSQWDIINITAQTGLLDHNNCCNQNFSSVSYTIHMRRKPLFLLFFLASPAVILVALSLASFAIPAESGERIGFVTTILLAMMVFLLLLPEYIPDNADELPIIGILLVITMVVITAVLLATIFVLRFYHHAGQPSPFIKGLLNFQIFKKKQNRKVEKDTKNSFVNDVHFNEDDAQSSIELKDLENQTEVHGEYDEELKGQTAHAHPACPPAHFLKRCLFLDCCTRKKNRVDIGIVGEARPNDRDTQASGSNESCCDDDQLVTWQDLSVRLDAIMFFAVLVMSLIACSLIYVLR